MSRRGWIVLAAGAAFAVICTCVGVLAVAGLWYAGRGEATPTPQVARGGAAGSGAAAGQVPAELPPGWQVVRTQNGQVAVVATERPDGASELPFQPGLFWFQEPLPQPLNPLQYAGVLYLRMQQQSDAVYVFDARWVSLYGWPAVQLAYAAVAQGQPYEGVLWIWTDGWNGYVMSFLAPYGTLAWYVQDLPAVVMDMGEEIVSAPGPLEGGAVPEVWTPEYWQDSPYGESWMPAYWDWDAIDAGAPMFDDFEDPFAGSSWDDTSQYEWETWRELHREGDALTTWMNEEWAQVLSGTPPEPSWVDEAGNLYWEGSSGMLHEWSPDYPSDW